MMTIKKEVGNAIYKSLEYVINTVEFGESFYDYLDESIPADVFNAHEEEIYKIFAELKENLLTTAENLL